MEKIPMNFVTDSKRNGRFEVYGTIEFLKNSYRTTNLEEVKEVTATWPLGIEATDRDDPNIKYRLFVHPVTNAIVAYKMI